MTVTSIRGRSRGRRPNATRSRLLTVTSHTAGLDSSRETTVSVRGEVDTTNAKEFATTVCDAAAAGGHVTVDLTELDFMAIDGVAALHAINAQLLRTVTAWSVVPGAAVSRVLELCDPEGLIPVRPPALRAAESA